MELLAPAGSYKSLIAAIYSGADAVYLGLDKFNARAKADNFNKENIKEIVDLCHIHNVKVYVTFNTLIKDNEFKEFAEEVDAAAKANVDAFLVTDLGTLSVFKKYNIPLHASTQMGIHNYEGAKLAKELGFSRVVLSREALKDDIKKIKTLGLEIEFFVHGALCVSFSGGCLLSSFMSGDSGNRGLCKQPCRLPYTSSLTGKDKYYLSPSDQCFIENLKLLEEWGVDSLKIEGRLKAPHYVGQVVREYRLALEGAKSPNYAELLRRAYNRGSFTKGYNFDATKDLMSINVQGNIGEYVGVVKKRANSSLYLELEKELHLKDGVKVLYNGAEVGGFLVDNIKKEGEFYIVKTNKVYPEGSKLYVTLDNDMVERFENVDIRIPVKIDFFANEGKLFKITVKAYDTSITREFDLVQSATTAPISYETVVAKLSEVGGSNYRVEHISGEVSENAFYSMSRLKAIKRDMLKELGEQIIVDYNAKKQAFTYDNTPINIKPYNAKNILVEIEKDIDFDVDVNKVDFVVKIDNYNESNIKNWLIYNKIERYILKLPKILRSKDIDVVKNFIANDPKVGGILAENLGAVEIARELDLPCIFGAGMNLLNSNNLKTFDIKEYVQSVELARHENLNGAYIYSYGYIPLMTFTHCPVQVNTGCTCANCKYSGDFYYENRNNKYMVVREKINSCYFNLYSPKILDLSQLGYKKVYISLSRIEDEAKNAILNFVENKDIISENPYLGHAYLPIK